MSPPGRRGKDIVVEVAPGEGYVTILSDKQARGQKWQKKVLMRGETKVFLLSYYDLLGPNKDPAVRSWTGKPEIK